MLFEWSQSLFQIQIPPHLIMLFVFFVNLIKIIISDGFDLALFLTPKCIMSTCVRKYVCVWSQRRPHGQSCLNCLLCSDQTKTSRTKCFLRFWVFLIERKLNAQMVSVIHLCVCDPEKESCANGIFPAVWDHKHFACPHALCVLCCWKNTLFPNGFVELLIQINIIRMVSQMRVFLTKSFTLKWHQLFVVCRINKSVMLKWFPKLFGASDQTKAQCSK